MYSKIVGTGGYLPPNILTNADLEKMVDTKDQWIVERTGIHQRHIADKDQTTVDLAYEAAKKSIESANIENSDIDLIIVATTTPNLVFPSTACLLQEKLGIHGCPAFDIQAVCTGFVYALSVADKFIKSGSSKCALIIGAETLSRILDWEDRTTCILFGDGAGAVILKASDKPGILSTHIHADGQYKDLLSVNGGVSQNSKLFQDAEAYIQMKGSEVFKMAVRTLGAIVDETLEASNMEKSDIDWLVPHQANIRIISATAKKLKMPMDKVITTVGLHGNTSAASIPLAYDVAVRDGRIKPGETVLMEAFGGGFTWGSVLFNA